MKAPYSVAEIAELLEVSPQTVRTEARAGRLPAVKVGRKWLFPRERIESFLLGGESRA